MDHGDMAAHTGRRRGPTGPADEPTVGLRLGLVVLAALAAVAATLVGAVAGFAWSFGACYKQTCSDVDAAAIVLLPLVGLTVGVGGGIATYARRHWFYAHPRAVWVPLALVGGLLALLVASAVIGGI